MTRSAVVTIVSTLSFCPNIAVAGEPLWRTSFSAGLRTFGAESNAGPAIAFGIARRLDDLVYGEWSLGYQRSRVPKIQLTGEHTTLTTNRGTELPISLSVVVRPVLSGVLRPYVVLGASIVPTVIDSSGECVYGPLVRHHVDRTTTAVLFKGVGGMGADVRIRHSVQLCVDFRYFVGQALELGDYESSSFGRVTAGVAFYY
jgi:hypothetical protein